MLQDELFYYEEPIKLDDYFVGALLLVGIPLIIASILIASWLGPFLVAAAAYWGYRQIKLHPPHGLMSQWVVTPHEFSHWDPLFKKYRFRIPAGDINRLFVNLYTRRHGPPSYELHVVTRRGKEINLSMSAAFPRDALFAALKQANPNLMIQETWH